MSKKILVAGAGHGGLVAGTYLAKKGYDVSVFEKLKREELGYPWDDMMNRDTFEVAGIAEFDAEDVILHPSVTFVPPSLKNSIKIEFTPDKANYEIERVVLYKYLLKNAEAKGVKLFFESEANLLLDEKNERVAGLTVNGEKIYGDLVIDSAGGNSPILNALPSSYGIKYGFKDMSRFFTYRGRFEHDASKECNFKDSFAMYLLFNGLKGISWFKIVDGLCDVLIGSVDPINETVVKDTLEKMKTVEPSFTGKLVTGGLYNIIPFGPPLNKLVGNNYAAIGDAACMAIPINGSGISNAIYAGKILAETIINADTNLSGKQGYTEASLYTYQKDFTLQHGAKMHEIATIKNFLLTKSIDDLNFLFDKAIVQKEEMTASIYGKDIKIPFAEMLKRGMRGISKPKLLLGLARTLEKGKRAKKLAEKRA